MTTYVPPARKPNVRTNNSKVNEFDAYGYRPLTYPWKLLSAYEFMQQWRCEPLLVPAEYRKFKHPARTTWTQKGTDLTKTEEYKQGRVAARLGEHL